MDEDIKMPIPIPPLYNANNTGTDNTDIHTSERYNTHSTGLNNHDYYCSEVSQYLALMRDAINKRMDKYDKKTAELENIINWEKIIEDSSRKTCSTLFWVAILYPALLSVIFVVLLYFVFSEGKKEIIDSIKYIFAFLPASVVLFFVKPLINFYSYNKRLDAIEKELKINGNR